MISQVEGFNKSLNSNIAFASDEFFVLAGLPLPEDSYYGSYDQLEDGVGTIRTLLDDFNNRKSSLPKKISKPTTIHFATGKIAVDVLKQIKKECVPIP